MSSSGSFKLLEQLIAMTFCPNVLFLTLAAASTSHPSQRDLLVMSKTPSWDGNHGNQTPQGASPNYIMWHKFPSLWDSLDQVFTEVEGRRILLDLSNLRDFKLNSLNSKSQRLLVQETDFRRKHI